MGYPTIQFATGGSDTLASGAGPTVAVTGVLASCASNTTVTITDAVDLSGVAVDGTAALWVATASGRRWSSITAISGSSPNWTVTVATAYGVTASGLSWAIGGKRLTLANSTRLGNDILPGWQCAIGNTQTLTAAFAWPSSGSVTANAVIRVYGSNTTRTLITTATNSQNIFEVGNMDQIIFENFQFTNTAAVKGSYAASTGMCFVNRNGGTGTLKIKGCIMDGFVCAVDCDNQNTNALNSFYMVDSEVKNCTDTTGAIRLQANASGSSKTWLDNCYLHDNTGADIYLQHSNTSLVCTYCTFQNGTIGITGADTGVNNGFHVNLCYCSFRNKSGARVDLLNSGYQVICHDNVFVSCVGGGFKMKPAEQSNDSAYAVPYFYNNAFYSNTAGNVINGPPTYNDIILTADPFKSATDSSLNTTPGGGAALVHAASQAPNVTASQPGSLGGVPTCVAAAPTRSEEHTSELQ